MLQTSPTDNLFRAFDPTPLPFDRGTPRAPRSRRAASRPARPWL